MQIARWVGQMETMPRGYAVAWVDPCAMRAWCLPIGLHIIASAWFSAWERFLLWRMPGERERIWTEAWNAGREHGVAHGRVLGRADAEMEEMRRVAAECLRQQQIARVVEELRNELRAIREETGGSEWSH